MLALPEDMLAEMVTVPDGRRFVPTQASPSEAQLRQMHAMLLDARNPLLLLGSSNWTAAGREAVAAGVDTVLVVGGSIFRRGGCRSRGGGGGGLSRSHATTSSATATSNLTPKP